MTVLGRVQWYLDLPGWSFRCCERHGCASSHFLRSLVSDGMLVAGSKSLLSCGFVRLPLLRKQGRFEVVEHRRHVCTRIHISHNGGSLDVRICHRCQDASRCLDLSRSQTHVLGCILRARQVNAKHFVVPLLRMALLNCRRLHRCHPSYAGAITRLRACMRRLSALERYI